jgi:hypothetical protein
LTVRVNEELKDYLGSQGFAVLCVELDLGQGEEFVILVKSTGDVIGALRERGARVEVGWRVAPTPWGPVVCVVLRCRHPEVGELAGETYLDPGAPADRGLLDRLATQQRLRVAFLDEEVCPAWLAEAAWDEVRRLEAQQASDRAEELLERADTVDFARAQAHFQDAEPLDRLISRLFPE